MMVHVAFPLSNKFFQVSNWECVVVQEYHNYHDRQVRYSPLKTIQGRTSHWLAEDHVLLRYAFSEHDVPEILTLVKSDTWSMNKRNLKQVRLFPCEWR